MPSTMKPRDKEAALKRIAKDLHAEGLTDRKTMGQYHSGADNGWEKWSFEADTTVDGEIVSPLLKDDEESWRQLETVCNIVKKHGGVVNSQAGSHVHVSTGSYGHSTAKHGELHRTVTQHEDLMYRLATNPAAGSHRGSGWCKPNIVDSEDDIDPDHLGGSKLFTSEHSNMLNMQASDSKEVEKSHVEFRMWDGSLNPAVIQRQVMFSVAMTDHAERSVIANGGSKKPTSSPKKYGSHKEDEARVLAEAGVSEHTPETLMKVNEDNAALLDRLFRRAEDRKRALELFARNSWQA